MYRKQESRPSPRKKKCKKVKWLSEEALQIAVKSKGEEEIYTHLNAEFQRIARRDKKAFLGDQCKEIEENSRMGKTSFLLARWWGRRTCALNFCENSKITTRC